MITMNYRNLTTTELKALWERERKRLAAKKDAVIADFDELIAMRKELDAREVPPSVDYYFTADVPD